MCFGVPQEFFHVSPLTEEDNVREKRGRRGEAAPESGCQVRSGVLPVPIVHLEHYGTMLPGIKSPSDSGQLL